TRLIPASSTISWSRAHMLLPYRRVVEKSRPAPLCCHSKRTVIRLLSPHQMERWKRALSLRVLGYIATKSVGRGKTSKSCHFEEAITLCARRNATLFAPLFTLYPILAFRFWAFTLREQ